MDNTELIQCRLCAEYKPQNQQLNLNFNEDNCIKIANKLRRFNIEFDINKDLPKTVCRACTQALDSAFEFITAVEQAQLFFEQLLYQKIKGCSSNANKSVFNEVHTTIKVEHNEYSLENDMEIDLSKTEDIKYEKGMVFNHMCEENVVNNFLSIQFEEDSSKTINAPISGEDSDNSNFEQLENTNTFQKKESAWKDYTWKCRFCETLFPNIDELLEHSMKHHSACNPQQCVDCNKVKLKFNKFLAHVRSHENRKKLKTCCVKCDRTFSSAFLLNKHYRTHQLYNTNYKCLGCNNTFPSEDELNEHRNMFYKGQFRGGSVVVDKNNLTCEFCMMQCKTVQTLKSHMMHKHMGESEKKFICEFCGKAYINLAELTNHKKHHSDVRYQCEICKFSFSTIFKLRTHARNLHFNKKIYSCDYCGRQYRSKKTLRGHIKIHTEPQTVCPQCGKKFNNPNYLKIHLRQHTGDKPYSCDICNRDFTNGPNRNKHMLRKHGVDNRKRKRTENGLCVVDPDTGNVIPPDENKILEWKEVVINPVKRKRKSYINKES